MGYLDAEAIDVRDAEEAGDVAGVPGLAGAAGEHGEGERHSAAWVSGILFFTCGVGV